jgi:hypothetical protein
MGNSLMNLCFPPGPLTKSQFMLYNNAHIYENIYVQFNDIFPFQLIHQVYSFLDGV